MNTIKHQSNAWTLVLCSIVLSSCASREGVEGEIPRDPIQVGETMVQTSYDYSRPEGVAPDSKPVWILPVINSGWKPAKVDSRTGDWVGGHYSATVVEDGKWATLEEAELSGKPYILPGETRPIIPTPVRTQTPGSTGEINATTLEQKLARLDKLERESSGRGSRDVNSPSKRSLINQSAVPNLPQSDNGGERRNSNDNLPGPGNNPDDNLPPMTIPGITDGLGGGSGAEPARLSAAPNLPPLPPPPPESSGPTVLPGGGGATPSSISDPSQGPVSLTKPSPSPRYNEATGEIVIGTGTPGSSISVSTPKGPATVAYGEDGEVSVTIGGKTRTIKLAPPQNQVKIKLTK
jgi:hypothetical protein